MHEPLRVSTYFQPTLFDEENAMPTVTKPRATQAADLAREVYADFDTTPAKVRAWAQENGLDVAAKGRIHPDVLSAYATDHA